MIRICLCLLIACASAGVAARDVKMSSPNDGSCPDSVTDREPARASVRKPAPARETRAKPSVHSDWVGNGRQQSPRWHSFLPGMFR